ncbi:MAG: NADH-quinone oxidoreductase subunit A [Candidatus Thermoplasmatota archaeon]|jgi:NADH-quinone oxidoreductase subunit A|nr:NADH-quinone oxidoreductase subunit A [Candidatus Thermoplasmatota archaeon]
MDAGTESFIVFAVIAVIFGVGSIIANRMLGARRVKSYLQDLTYECGEEAEGSAMVDFPTHHYVFAIVFVAVDVLGFLLALWAVSLHYFVKFDEWLIPALVVGVFSCMALLGIYYVLRGEQSLWV